MDSSNPSSRTTFPLEDGSLRYRHFRQQLAKAKIPKRGTPEHLIPTVEVKVAAEYPALVKSKSRMSLVEREQLQAWVERLAPWDHSLHFGDFVTTGGRPAFDDLIFDAGLIIGGVERFCDLDGATVLDMGCGYHGYIAMEMAWRGAAVTGADDREPNISKAMLLARHFGLSVALKFENVFDIEGEFDVVSNLGLLDRTTDPYRLVENTFRRTRKVAIIEAVAHHFPVSAFIQSVAQGADSSPVVALQPTYRAMIDLMHAVGFKEVFEVMPTADSNTAGSERYAKRGCRCFIGLK
jgi:hypothetical protein